jgi:uncharacterized protein (TIGR03086 family)
MTSPDASVQSAAPAADPRAVFARTVSLAAGVIETVPPDRLQAPTPCGMDVRDLLEHLVMVLRRVAAAGRDEPTTTWPTGAPDVADAGMAEAWRAAAPDVEAAWSDDVTLERPTEVPWGTFTGRDVLAVYINEIVVHTWDLARGIDQPVEWDDEIVATADEAIHAQLPMADRTEMWAGFAASLPPGVEWADPFGNAVDVPDDAPAIDRLVAWNGRRP